MGATCISYGTQQEVLPGIRKSSGHDNLCPVTRGGRR